MPWRSSAAVAILLLFDEAGPQVAPHVIHSFDPQELREQVQQLLILHIVNEGTYGHGIGLNTRYYSNNGTAASI